MRPPMSERLWHLDFHHGSLKVLTPGGQWLRPIALGILDDHSRLCCHVQWYLWRRPRIWSTACPRRSRNAVCRVRC